MPQANITYNTRYNRDLASRVEQMDDDMLWYNKHQYHPSPMGYRSSDFHNAQGTANTPNIGRNYEHDAPMTGGVQATKFILNGNSPAYPPINMRAGLAVSSGGGRGQMAGVDGAVSGGSFWKDFEKGFTDTVGTAARILPVAKTAASLLGYGHGGATSGGVPSGGRTEIHRPSTKTRGGNFFKGLLGLAKKIAPIALPLLTGLGRKATMADKKNAIAQAIEGGNFWDGFKKGFSNVMGLASKVAPLVLPLMTGLGKKQYGGAFNFGKFLEKGVNFAKKEIAPIVVKKGKELALKKGKEMLGLGATRRAGVMYPPRGGAMVGNKKDTCGRSSGTRDYGTPCGAGVLDDAIEMTKPMVRKGKAALKDAINEYAPRATKALKDKADRLIKKAVGGVPSGGGRSKRAEIVKRIMKERGVKMIEASKIVKAEGLYQK